MLKKLAFTAFVMAFAAYGAAFAAEPSSMAPSTKSGMFVDAKGMTLYTFAKDTPGKSVCNGKCATNWPPLLVADGAKASGNWSVVTRDDGLKQWAYKGMPLYGWVKDKKPGDMTGDGALNGAWHVARP